MSFSGCIATIWISTALLQLIVLVTPILRPYITHLHDIGILEKPDIFWTCFFGERLGLLVVLALSTVGHDLVFLCLVGHVVATLKGRLNSHLLKLHHIGAIDEGNVLNLSVFLSDPCRVALLELLSLLMCLRNVLLPFLGPFVHFVHLLLDDAEHWIWFELHRARPCPHRLGVVICRPLLERASLVMRSIVGAYVALLARALIATCA